MCGRIKEELLRNFNLHTIVRLPNGVFAPYTSIPTNLLSVNLDIKNPNAAEALEHLPPEKLVEDILVKEQRIMEIMAVIKAELETHPK